MNYKNSWYYVWKGRMIFTLAGCFFIFIGGMLFKEVGLFVLVLVIPAYILIMLTRDSYLMYKFYDEIL